MSGRDWSSIGRQMSLFLLYQAAKNAQEFAEGQKLPEVARAFGEVRDYVDLIMHPRPRPLDAA